MIAYYLADKGPYVLFAFLLSAGAYLLVSHRNLLKGVIGLYLFQTGVIVFFIILGVKDGGTIPIHYSTSGYEGVPLDNPLPHALMLTAIVVGVATLGLALAILRRIFAEGGHIQDNIWKGGDGQ